MEWCLCTCAGHSSDPIQLGFARGLCQRRKTGVREALLLWRPAWGWLCPRRLISPSLCSRCLLEHSASSSSLQCPSQGGEIRPTFLTDDFIHSEAARGGVFFFSRLCTDIMLDTTLNILNWINGFCALMCVYMYSQCVCVSEKASDIKSEARHADENGEWHERGGEYMENLR